MARVLSLLLLAGFLTDGHSASCAAPRTSATKYRVVSHRNQTGHWITRLHMERDTLDGTNSNSDMGSYDMYIEHRTSVCQDDDTVNIIAQVTAPPVRVGNDYELVPGLGYYKLHKTPSVWMDARRTCEAEGAHLVILNSEREAKVAAGLFVNPPKTASNLLVDAGFYVGVNDMYDEGHFVTVFGDPLSETGFNEWEPTEPNNAGTVPGEDCVILTVAAKLNDVQCSIPLWFICEQDLY